MKITCDICSHIWENQRYRKCADGKNRCKNCHKEYYNVLYSIKVLTISSLFPNIPMIHFPF